MPRLGSGRGSGGKEKPMDEIIRAIRESHGPTEVSMVLVDGVDIEVERRIKESDAK